MRLSSSALSVCTIKKKLFKLNLNVTPPPPHSSLLHAALQDPWNQIFPAEAVKYAELITLSRWVKMRRRSVFVTKHSFHGKMSFLHLCARQCPPTPTPPNVRLGCRKLFNSCFPLIDAAELASSSLRKGERRNKTI